MLILFSYNGKIFHQQADSNYGHDYSTLAKIEGTPLAVGGYAFNINKAEILDISTNTWTEVADYPYHN